MCLCVCVSGDTGVDRLVGAQEQVGWAGHHREGLPSSGRFPKSIFCVNRNLGKFSSFSQLLLLDQDYLVLVALQPSTQLK